VGWTPEESGFDSQQGKGLSSTPQSPDRFWGLPSLPSNEYPGLLPLRKAVESGSWQLTSMYVVLRSRMVELYLHFPICLHYVTCCIEDWIYICGGPWSIKLWRPLWVINLVHGNFLLLCLLTITKYKLTFREFREAHVLIKSVEYISVFLEVSGQSPRPLHKSGPMLNWLTLHTSCCMGVQNYNPVPWALYVTISESNAVIICV
jgi:hypothetical protein